jgi:hypothetical protein
MVWNLRASPSWFTPRFVCGEPAALKATLLGARQVTFGKVLSVSQRLVRFRDAAREERVAFLSRMTDWQFSGRVRKLWFRSVSSVSCLPESRCPLDMVKDSRVGMEERGRTPYSSTIWNHPPAHCPSTTTIVATSPSPDVTFAVPLRTPARYTTCPTSLLFRWLYRSCFNRLFARNPTGWFSCWLVTAPSSVWYWNWAATFGIDVLPLPVALYRFVKAVLDGRRSVRGPVPLVELVELRNARYAGWEARRVLSVESWL